MILFENCINNLDFNIGIIIYNTEINSSFLYKQLKLYELELIDSQKPICYVHDKQNIIINIDYL